MKLADNIYLLHILMTKIYMWCMSLYDIGTACMQRMFLLKYTESRRKCRNQRIVECIRNEKSHEYVIGLVLNKWAIVFLQNANNMPYLQSSCVHSTCTHIQVSIFPVLLVEDIFIYLDKISNYIHICAVKHHIALWKSVYT